jgi:hypothetical protein
MSHTPRLQQLLDAIPRSESITASEEGMRMAVAVLATLNAALRSSSRLKDAFSWLLILFNRRVKLRRKVFKYKKHALSFMAPPAIVKDIKKSVDQETSELRKELKLFKGKPRTAQSIIRRKLRTLTEDPNAEFVDICAEEEGSKCLDLPSFEKHKTAYNELIHQQTADSIHAQQMRDEIKSTPYTEMNYVSLTEFS